ncbi:CDP-glucose 4,6-dehydratase [Candidatus Accumulibacter aalborgensis]|uniref:CDP-glucose 4,6-dehydratase n=1 Tax=Candidatus Accumulibacter aalborgensis TaxID=1860102 RepID=UPI000B028D49|nr:CDP-glucose 4,6-dehydratase [Candidatus Accumulibacter aalborgensis]
MNRTFWRGRRVFLTGHTGFKGSWISLWLQSMGAQVVGYALPPPTKPSLFDSADVGNGMVSIMGNVLDLARLRSAVEDHRPAVVFHMAAQPLVRHSYIEPVETYATNVMGTVHLLEAVRKTSGVRAVVNITTDKCYENREWAWGYRENEPMGGYDPYSNSKGCAELVSAAYRSSFFNPSSHAQHGVALATVRAGNVIGGGDWAQDRLVPDILAAFEQGKPVRIRNRNAVRPWQHVLEPLRGYLTLAERLHEQGPSYGEGWNFGPHDEDAKSVGWVVQRMAGMWGSDARWQIDSGEHPHEAAHLKLDVSKARSRLDWRPALTLDDSLKLIVDWARLRHAGANIRQLTLEQIHAYETLTLTRN